MAGEVHIRPAPARFAGPFSRFFAEYVEPNLPTPARVAEFDALLRHHLSLASAVHVLRRLPRQDRGTLASTEGGHRIMPADNSPGWWLHARLLDPAPLPTDPVAFFDAIPTHFFEVAGGDNLNRAGYHLAHVLNVGNRDTRWSSWDGPELARRMRLNLHPCNWFLLARHDWRRAGEDHGILRWVACRHAERYGATYAAFCRDVAAVPVGVAPADPWYEYPAAAPPERAAAVPGARRKGSSSDNPRRLSRPAIWSALLGGDVVLDIRLGDRRYLVPHDSLVEWVGANTAALATASWVERGHYSWPVTSRAMRAFLDRFEAEPDTA